MGLVRVLLLAVTCVVTMYSTAYSQSQINSSYSAEYAEGRPDATSKPASSTVAKWGRSPEMFGAICDGVTDDYLSLQKWLNSLAAQQSTTPVRGWLANSCFSSKSLTVKNIGLFLEGAGPSIAQLIFASGANGLIIDNSGWSRAAPVEIHNVAFLTQGIATGTALTVIGNANYQNLVRTEVLQNVRIAGVDPSRGWARGHDGRFVLNGLIDQIYISGVASFSGAYTGCGIYLSGGSNIVNITNVNIDWVDIGVCINTDRDNSANEGIRLIDSTARAVHYGFVSRGRGNYYVVQGGHYDVVNGAVEIGSPEVVGGDFSMVSSLFVLRSAADNWSNRGFVGIGIDANYPIVTSNTIWLDAGEKDGVVRQAGTTGVLIGDPADASKAIRGDVFGNELIGLSNGILLLPNTRYTTVFGNQGDAYGNKAGVNVRNEGDSTNAIYHNPYVGSDGAASENSGSALNRPSVSAYLTADKISVTGNGAQVGLAPLKADLDLGSNLNLETGVFTATVAGSYEVSVLVTFTNVTQDFSKGQIVLSGPTFPTRLIPIVPTAGGGSITTQIHLPAGGKMAVYASAAGGPKVVGIAGGSGLTRIDINLIRAD